MEVEEKRAHLLIERRRLDRHPLLADDRVAANLRRLRYVRQRPVRVQVDKCVSPWTVLLDPAKRRFVKFYERRIWEKGVLPERDSLLPPGPRLTLPADIPVDRGTDENATPIVAGDGDLLAAESAERGSGRRDPMLHYTAARCRKERPGKGENVSSIRHDRRATAKRALSRVSARGSSCKRLRCSRKIRTIMTQRGSG
jgi:hypothetical protein